MQVAPEPSAVEMLRDLVIELPRFKRIFFLDLHPIVSQHEEGERPRHGQRDQSSRGGTIIKQKCSQSSLLKNIL